jgi:hypothetical protein
MPSLSRLMKPFQFLLIGVDRLLVHVATPFGVRVKEPRRRYAILLGIYALIYILGFLPIPVLPLVALTIGYVGVLAVGRAWVLNEKERTLIAKKLKDGNPDDMPDLRWTALVSALQLVILFPLIFQQVQWNFGLYTVPEGTNFWDWTVFTLDSYNKAFLNLLEVYGVRVHHISYDSTWGRHLVTLCRLTFDYLLIQGIFRLLAIRETVRDAVAAVKTDPDMAVRIGRRAVEPLIAVLQNTSRIQRIKVENWLVRNHVAHALGELHDPRAVGPLIVALQDMSDDFVRFEAAEALGKLNDPRAVEPLIAALKSPENDVRKKAAYALFQLDDPRAVEPLIAALQDPEEDVRTNAAAALGRSQDPRAVEPLIAALQDPGEGEYGTVIGVAAEWLGLSKDPRAVEGLIAALQDSSGIAQSEAAWALGRS